MYPKKNVGKRVLRKFLNPLIRIYGWVSEWSMVAVLKTAVPQGTVGSNPTPSANFEAKKPFLSGVYYLSGA
jgi:hypothetical protein